VSSAKFKIIRGSTPSPFTDCGFDGASGETLHLQLEDSVASDVRSCVYSIFKASPGAGTAPVLAASGIASPPTAAVDITLPATPTGGVCWIIQCQTNNGEAVKVNGRDDYTVNTRRRLIAQKDALGLSPIIAGETTEYNATDGWCIRLKAATDVVASGTSGVQLATTTPAVVDTGAGAVGVGTKAARFDHVHQVNAVETATASKLPVRDANGVLRNVRSAVGTALTTAVAGFAALCTTAATVGAPNYSPPIQQSGTAWNATAAASQQVDWMTQVQGVDGNPPSSSLKWFAQSNGGGFTERLSIDSTGQLSSLNTITFSSVAPGTLQIAQRSGTGANAGLNLAITGQQGQQQSGVNANNSGGDVIVSTGAPGTGGSGGAGATGALRVKFGATNGYTVSADASNVFTSLDAGHFNFFFTANGVNQGIAFSANDATGVVAFQTPFISIADRVTGVTALSVLPSTTATSISAAKASALTITQSAQTTDVACLDMTISPQAPFATATLTNRTPASFVVSLAAPTNGGTSLPALKVKHGGTTFCQVGRYDSAAAYGAFWGGSSAPSTTNFAFLGDGSAVAYFNAPNGGTLNLSFNGSSANGLNLTASSLVSNISAWSWAASAVFTTSDFTHTITGDFIVNASHRATFSISATTSMQIDPGVVTINKVLAQTRVTSSTSGATHTIDLSQGTEFEILMQNTVTTLTLNNPTVGTIYYFQFKQDATGNRLLSKPAAWFVAGSSFTLSTSPDRYDAIIMKWDGSKYIEMGRSIGMF
jgi:hypothetical protein